MASEMGEAQTDRRNPGGVVGSDKKWKKPENSRMTWESQPEKVIARYAKFEGHESDT